MEIERRKRRHSHIDIAPLVDVVFNLLLFFMLTFNMALDQTIPIRLPQSTTADDLSASRIVVTISRDGLIRLRNQAIPIEALSAVLRQQPGWSPDVPVHIRSDREAAVGLLVAVIDSVRHSGSKNFQVVTEKSLPGGQ
ncbi:ExbD/TolR family protein [Desulfatirhabdium butyrativorans]|uniref:ExbD/TolR family protein n=1 Tax=Desulfatirhabdium butyrativorans TaxID=340467 RepID=UPI000410926E|nr:biopolymer transporter ExbD [Desulfatirhabdium butyrativorans]